MAILRHHTITFPNGEEYYALMSLTNYAGDTGTEVGIVPTDEEKRDRPITKVAELLKAGVIVPLQANLANKRSRRIYCTRAKLETALAGLVGNTLAGSTIKDVDFPRRRYLI